MLITRKSMYSGKVNTMDLPITDEQIARWESDTLIQNAFPNLNADQREFLMTGILPEEWDEMFPSDD
jgi:hypothetical protein